MKRLRLHSVPLLEGFIKDESISLEDRLTVFKQTLNSFPLFVLSIKDGDCKTIENPEAVLNGMVNTLCEIKADSTKTSYTGFTVLYN